MKILILISKSSWANHYSKEILKNFRKYSNNVKIIHDHSNINKNNDICIIFSYFKIIPKTYLNYSKHNLVVHESDLPKGRGMSPLTWQILNNKKKIIFTLFEAKRKIDDGNFYFKKRIIFSNLSLFQDIKKKQLFSSLELYNKFLNYFKKFKKKPKSFIQMGKPSYYKIRNQKHSQLDIEKSIKSQFNLLRCCDNENYPAFFLIKKKKFILKIFKK